MKDFSLTEWLQQAAKTDQDTKDHFFYGLSKHLADYICEGKEQSYFSDVFDEHQLRILYFQLIKDTQSMTIYFLGMLKMAFDLYQEGKGINYELDQFCQLQKSYVGTDAMIQVLYDKGAIVHKDLAKALGKSPSALSSYMKRLQKYGVASAEKVGKNKYYSLTNKGANYYKKHSSLFRDIRNNNVDSISEKYVLDVLDIIATDVPLGASTYELLEKIDYMYPEGHFKKRASFKNALQKFVTVKKQLVESGAKEPKTRKHVSVSIIQLSLNLGPAYDNHYFINSFQANRTQPITILFGANLVETSELPLIPFQTT